MPSKRSRLKCRHSFVLVAVLLLVPASVKAQTGRVALTGSVSETIALSVQPNLDHGNIRTNVVSSGNTVRITLSGDERTSPVIRVPVLVRSNSGFRISAAVESKTAVLSQLSVMDVRATGTLVSPQAITELNVPQQFDLRERDESNSSAANPLDLSRPLFVVSGPRVSLGGTLDSPNNALQITLLIRLRPEPPPGWLVHLTFVGSAESLIQ